MVCSWKRPTVTSSVAIFRACASARSVLREKAPTVVLTLAMPTLTSRMGANLPRRGSSVQQARGPQGLEPADELPDFIYHLLEALAHVQLQQQLLAALGLGDDGGGHHVRQRA